MRNLLLLLFLCSGYFVHAECRRDTIYYYDFTPNKTLTGRTINKFDSKNLIIQSLEQNWDAISKLYTPTSRYTSTYDNNKNRLTFLQENWSGTIWTNYTNKITTYNSANKETIIKDQTWNGTAWQDYIVNTRTYDLNNNQILAVFTFYNTNSTVVAFGGKYESVYDSKSRNIINRSYDLQIPSLNYTLNDIDTNFVYDVNNLKLSNENYRYDASTSKLIKWSLKNFTYNSNKDELTYTAQSWNSTTSTWENGIKATQTYTPTFKVINYLFEIWNKNDNTWTKESQYNLKRNSDENTIEYSRQNWVNTKWVNVFKNTYEYNSDKDANAIDAYYSFDTLSNTYINHNRQEYKCTFITANNDLFIYDKNVEIYPNPTTNGIIHVKVEEASNFSLIDMNGRLISQGKLNEGLNEINMLPNVSNGLYFLKVGNTVKKVIYNR
jgi:Secretion system C-terminal sorting domain